jgi:hypothetical protein
MAKCVLNKLFGFFLELICFSLLFQMDQSGSDGGSFLMRIQNRGGRFIRPRDLEPGWHHLITYVWSALPHSQTLVQLWPGDDLWMFLP